MGKVGTWQLSAHWKTGNFSSLEYQVSSFPRESDAQLSSVYDFELAVTSTRILLNAVSNSHLNLIWQRIFAHSHTHKRDRCTSVIAKPPGKHTDVTVNSKSYTLPQFNFLDSFMNRNSGRIRALLWYLIITYQSHNNNDHLTQSQEGRD